MPIMAVPGDWSNIQVWKCSVRLAYLLKTHSVVYYQVCFNHEESSFEKSFSLVV